MDHIIRESNYLSVCWVTTSVLLEGPHFLSWGCDPILHVWETWLPKHSECCSKSYTAQFLHKVTQQGSLPIHQNTHIFKVNTIWYFVKCITGFATEVIIPDMTDIKLIIDLTHNFCYVNWRLLFSLMFLWEHYHVWQVIYIMNPRYQALLNY